MTAIIVANAIAAVIVVAGLAAAMRLGYNTARGHWQRALRSFEVRRGEAAGSELRRAA
jgi:hypothetical protein